MSELQAGALIDGRYKVLARLGSGGMADVFLAQDDQLGRKVALKLLHERFAEDPGFVERFRREAQSAAGLQHPNVVSVYDRGAYDGTYYIAMEYLAGRTLKQLIGQDAPLTAVRAIDITIQILRAARFAHHQGVIHRDIKPHNVIVDDADNAKVTDFGIARAGASDMTETGSIMGTAQYLSPEQAQGYAVSAASDLYSVAIVLYELLTGRVPFDAQAAVTIALKHVSESPPAPRAINPSIPPELEQVVMWALNKDPADRPADADQFIAALEQARAAIISGASAQHTASMPALAAAGPVPGGPPAPTPPAPAPEAPPAGDQAAVDGSPAAPAHRQGARKRRRRWLWALLALALAGGGVAGYALTRPSQKVVPPVVGQGLNGARTVLQNAGFGVSVLYVPNNPKPSGTVIAQQPLAGAKADAGSAVALTVSQGPGNGTVPSVQGLSLAMAKQLILKAGLTVGRTESQPSGQFPPGQVTRTDPAAGVTPPRGTAVTIFVSSGKAKAAQAAVPDVTGQSRPDATATLEAANFKVQSSTQASSSAAPGKVISQDPAGGSSATTGSVVTIVVAGAPSAAMVPDVTGDTLSAATSALTSDGFQVAQSTKDVRKQSSDGIVISQSPGAGTSASKGSTVAIVAGRYVAPPPPPPPTTTSRTTPTTSSPKTTP